MLQSMGLQRVGHDLVTQQQQFLWVKRPAWSPAQSLIRLQSMQCCLGCVFIWRLDWGRIFQAHSAYQQNSFLCSCGTESIASCLLSTEDHSQQQLKATHSSQRPPAVLCHMGFPSLATSSRQEVVCRVSMVEDCLFCNIIMRWHPIPFAVFCGLESNHMSTHTQEDEITQSMNTRWES